MNVFNTWSEPNLSNITIAIESKIADAVRRTDSDRNIVNESFGWKRAKKWSSVRLAEVEFALNTFSDIFMEIKLAHFCTVTHSLDANEAVLSKIARVSSSFAKDGR